MRVFRRLSALPPPAAASVVTLGVFDGVHVGHQRVIRRAVGLAARQNRRAAAITFANHPDALLRARQRPSITSLDHRLELFEALGLDLCLVLSFTRRLAAMPAETFVRRVIVARLRAVAVVVGLDCRFGRGGEGTPALLRALGGAYGFRVRVVHAARRAGGVVSSTAIRAAIAAGDLETARCMLGRRVSLRGTARPLKERGRFLFYPGHELLPPAGTYACSVASGGEWRRAVVTVPERRESRRASPLSGVLSAGPRPRRGSVVHLDLIRRVGGG